MRFGLPGMSPLERFRWWLRNFFGKSNGYDLNMSLAEEVGEELMGETTRSKGHEEVLAIIERIDREVIPLTFKWDQGTQAEIIKDTLRLTPDILDISKELAGIYLVMWSGCLTAAKIIAIGTRGGRNWPWMRRRYARRLEAIVEKRGQVFEAGVYMALMFKLGRREPVSFLGVPRDNILRRLRCA